MKGKQVKAKCINCGKVQIRRKGNSGIPCVNSGIYCGVMHVIEWLE